MTVSRVINNSGYAAAAVRARVWAAIEELGYVPNSVARSLRSSRTYTLALILADITNPFFMTVARGVEDAASAAGYMVILGNSDESAEKEHVYLQMLLQRQVDGILLVPAGDPTESLKLIQRQRAHVVVLDRPARGATVDVVRCDSEEGSFRLGRLLIDLGHRRFAVIAGAEGEVVFDGRVRGFVSALNESGLGDRVTVYHGDTETVFHGLTTQSSGYDMTLQALAASPAPTAIFAANNFHAIGALSALRDSGKRVPEDVALVAFDDLPPVFVTPPFLTVAAQPAYEMGRRAAELLIARIDALEPPPFQETLFKSELIVRRSSGGPVTVVD